MKLQDGSKIRDTHMDIENDIEKAKINVENTERELISVAEQLRQEEKFLKQLKKKRKLIKKDKIEKGK